jgi:ABC-type dipeptide/oligopeptide/nickel transport system permease subunit
MLSDGRQFLQLAPHVAIFPGLAILLTVLALNLLGDGLRDALDPKLRKTG